MIFPMIFAAFVLSGPPPNGDIGMLVAGTPAGMTLSLMPNATYRVSAPLVLNRPIRIVGNGARIVVADGAQIAGAVVTSSGVNNIKIDGLSIDANVDYGGADYGIWLRGGTAHQLSRLRVSNTSQACILLEDAAGTIKDSTLNQCGRELTIRQGGAANNHGIMIAALKQSVTGVTVTGNTITDTYRKGITAYTRAPGSLSGVTIANNRVTNAGLGGIFIANAPGAPRLRNVTIQGNVARMCYVGFEIDNVDGLTLSDNTAQDMRDRTGQPGAEGLLLHSVRNAEIRGLTIRGSGSGGITVIDSRNIRLIAPSIVDGNNGNNGYAPAIQLRGTSGSSVEDMSIVNTRTRPALTHGFIEIGPAGGNRSSVRQMKGTSSAPRSN